MLAMMHSLPENNKSHDIDIDFLTDGSCKINRFQKEITKKKNGVFETFGWSNMYSEICRGIYQGSNPPDTCCEDHLKYYEFV